MILIHTTTTNSELNILTTIKRKSVAFFTVKVPEMLENIWVTDSAICELSKDN